MSEDHEQDILLKFKTIRSNYEALLCSGKTTEADTRAEFIDLVLRDVLEWPAGLIKREEHAESGYLDYTLLHRERPYLVVEAKKNAVEFKLPTPSTRKHYKISGTLQGSPSVKDAIEQVRRYCDDKAARYAIATNGEVWIAFRAIRDDMPWRDGMARVFHSRDYIEKNLVDFWNLFSFKAVCSGSLDHELGPLPSAKRKFHRVVDSIFNSLVPLTRNRLNAQLHPLVEGVFRDIADKEQLEILQDCYVHSRSLKVVTDDLNFVITDSIPHQLHSEGTVDVGPGAKKKDKTLFENEMSESLRSSTGQLFLLLGGIGCGKTTFIKRYLRSTGKKLLDEHGASFYIDFLKAPSSPADAEKFVWETMLNEIRSRYGHLGIEDREVLEELYAPRIKGLEATILAGKKNTDRTDWISTYLADWQQELENYVPMLCKGLEKEGRATILVIDNLDQLPSQYQADVFVLAQSISRKINCTTIVSMREESYYTGTLQRSFTAYSNKKFHIASPNFAKLVKNRIQFAEKLLRLPDNGEKMLLGHGIALDKDALLNFLEIIRASIFQQNKNIIKLVESVCFGNMRLALQMFTDFLISGATDVDKMLSIHRNQGSYYVAFHEFLKSVMLGEKRYYHEQYSSIMNIFNATNAVNSSHFTALRLLQYLWDLKGTSSREGKGYVELATLIRAFEDAFDNRQDVIETLNRLVSEKLVEVNNRSEENIDLSTHVKISSSGWYYLIHLSSTFCYLDLVLQDTPINSDEVFSRLTESVRVVDNLGDKESNKKQRLEVRFERVEEFLEYLDTEENSEVEQLTDHSKLRHFFGPKIREQYNKEREYIRQRMQLRREKQEENWVPAVNSGGYEENS